MSLILSGESRINRIRNLRYLCKNLFVFESVLFGRDFIRFHWKSYSGMIGDIVEAARLTQRTNQILSAFNMLRATIFPFGMCCLLGEENLPRCVVNRIHNRNKPMQIRLRYQREHESAECRRAKFRDIWEYRLDG